MTAPKGAFLMGISKKKIEEEATKYQKSKTFQKFTKKTPKLHKELLSTNLRDPEHLNPVIYLLVCSLLQIHLKH